MLFRSPGCSPAPRPASLLSAVLTALRDCAGVSGLRPHCKAAAVVAKQSALAQHRHIRFPVGCVSPVDARYRIAQSRASGHHHRPHLLKPGRRKAWRYASGIGHDRRPSCPKRHPCRLFQPTATQRSVSRPKRRRQTSRCCNLASVLRQPMGAKEKPAPTASSLRGASR